MISSIEWIDNKVKMIDQTLLPHELKFLEFDDFRDVATSIKVMNIRGAPAIGVAAAMGMGPQMTPQIQTAGPNIFTGMMGPEQEFAMLGGGAGAGGGAGITT